MDQIDHLLKENQMALDLQSHTKNEVIHELATILDKSGKLKDMQEFIAAVQKREEEYSTAIGNGVAIPHGKTAAVNEASIVFGRSIRGIDYDAMDNQLSHLFIMIAVPEDSDDLHLKILSQLSRKLMHEDFRYKLMKADSTSEILSIFKNN
ncbi:PTS fructose transporter subunit IIA [Pullulanibacillus camelliae]|uniref:PTS fructose transporter subunit IIA n=1 Tax=Pullulanibacillus camelliae TaxID=1707096 RepID=A0A8J2VJG0_9BACL|nr:fructose PTS transporter subunit IIA [Pullulanibacillus camelliae]GGE27565.1 PTS fructose transporter subunit IIA [Pullulanibacillus camelliae]